MHIGSGVFAFFGGAIVLSMAIACSDPGAAALDVPQASSQSAADGGTAVTATGLPCDVDAVLKARCQTCHGAKTSAGASASLVTWDDLQKAGPGANANKKVYELVKERIHDDARPMPPSGPRLDAKELAAIDAFVGAGAKSSTATCANEAAPVAVKPLSCAADTVLKAKTPFTLAAGSKPDQYMCYGVDVTVPKKRHVTALAPKVDNKDIVHHILLFQTENAVSNEPFACDAFGAATWKLVAGWAPGGNNFELPPEAGFPEEEGTTHWVLQIHYNTTKTQTGSDQSGYELCTTDSLRPNDAGILAFGTKTFEIPPRASHTVRCDYPLDSKFKDVKIFSAWPHMHTLGKAMSTERLPGGDGTPEMIYEQKSFAFEQQGTAAIAKTMTEGDVMRTRCSWKNPGDGTVHFGEGTGDEMCFNFLGYYPNIPDQVIFGKIPLFTWVTPSLKPECTIEE